MSVEEAQELSLFDDDGYNDRNAGLTAEAALP
jgi:hypothetical protein